MNSLQKEHSCKKFSIKYPCKRSKVHSPRIKDKIETKYKENNKKKG